MKLNEKRNYKITDIKINEKKKKKEKKKFVSSILHSKNFIKTKNKVLEFLSLPTEILEKKTRCVTLSNESILIENFKSIKDYYDDYIKIHTIDMYIEIYGTKLFIEEYNGDNIYIKGKIKQIEYIMK